MYLNNEVAIKVAPTEIKAVVTAVVMIIVEGIGTSTSVKGISTIWASGGRGGVVGGVGAGGSDLGASSVVLIPSIPGGGLSTLGGTVSGL
tara:strand:- start:6293 stop:6562 length:270 start_codon:yes stop_codon:yes gene_type:complete